jgi:hypothetical protein
VNAGELKRESGRAIGGKVIRQLFLAQSPHRQGLLDESLVDTLHYRKGSAYSPPLRLFSIPTALLQLCPRNTYLPSISNGVSQLEATLCKSQATNKWFQSDEAATKIDLNLGGLEEMNEKAAMALGETGSEGKDLRLDDRDEAPSVSFPCLSEDTLLIAEVLFSTGSDPTS